MKNSTIKHAIGLCAAAITTLVLFSSVASLADNDKAAVLAAKIKPTTIATASFEASQ